MLALTAVAGSCVSASQFTFFITFHTLSVPRGLKKSLLIITRLHTLISHLKCIAGKAQLVSRAPASFWRALLVTNESLEMALLWRLVILQ